MACATLKRPLDFDPLVHDHRKSPKRQRCTPMSVSPSTSKPSTPSPFGEVKPPMTNAVIAAQIQAELRRMQRRRQIKSQPRRISGHHHFQGAEQAGTDGGSGSDSEPEMMTTAPSTWPGASSTGSDAAFIAASDSAAAAEGAAAAEPSAFSPKSEEKPLFNFKQVSLICERLVREREAALREEYDKILTAKLAEQYDAFVKFTHDQITRRLKDRPMSYVS